jgi:hypothetical protein
MTLSRRDEFAARAFSVLVARIDSSVSGSDIAEASRALADALIAELDRTAPNAWLVPNDARLFAHRILKLCDEIEAGK